MIEPSDVFDAVRRGYSELSSSDAAGISEYFSDVDPDSVAGHVANIKGLLFEQQYVDALAVEGIRADLFEATNHPVVDLVVYDGLSVAAELQLKATESVDYVLATLDANPDVPVVVTSEVAAQLDEDLVIDSGIPEEVLEASVSETLFDESLNPVSPLSVISWFFGLPF